MSNKKFTVRNLIEETNYKFNFKNFTESVTCDKNITEPLVHRLSLAVVGHFKMFPRNRIQVCGVTEYSYLESLSVKERSERIKEIISTFGDTIPAIIFTTGLQPFPEVIELGTNFDLPILGTNYEAVLFISELSGFLEERLAKSNSIQGVMLNVYGVGVVIVGDSGIGKSEAAIELLKRGHMFVADDIVKLYLSSSGVLMGTQEDIIKNFIEVRGLGIIDVKAIFGIGTIMERSRIELIIELKLFSDIGEYDRLGTEKKVKEILGVKIPVITLPVAPGRNIATLIEIAALNFRLQEKGYFAAEELDQRVIKAIKEKDETQ